MEKVKVDKANLGAALVGAFNIVKSKNKMGIKCRIYDMGESILVASVKGYEPPYIKLEFESKDCELKQRFLSLENVIA